MFFIFLNWKNEKTTFKNGTERTLRFLRTIHLDDNNFYGDIPNVYISHRFIGDNQIYGSIPPGIVNLVNLEIISMEKNQLISGTIPDDIGKLKKLQALNLHENR